MYKVLLKESQPVIVLGLKSTFEESDKNAVIDVCTSFTEMAQMLKAEQYQLVVMGPSFDSPEHPLQFMKLVKGYTKTIAALFVDSIGDLPVRQFYKFGMRGLLAKDITLPELKEAFKTMQQNDIYLSGSFKEQLISNYFAGEKLLRTLTSKERVIATLLSEGKNNNEICKLLELKPSTISTFKNRIFSKLQISNIIELKYPNKERKGKGLDYLLSSN